MKINKVELQNFKCHEKLSFEINSKNCLVYGENGSGKSSIYWALYSVFKVHYRNANFNYEDFKQRNANSDLSCKVTFDNDSSVNIPARDNSIDTGTSKTIYFANQNLLGEISCHKEDQFYDVLDNHFSKYFHTLQTYQKSYKKLKSTFDSEKETPKERKEKFNLLNPCFEAYINNLKEKVNVILKEDFHESFNIDWEYTPSEYIDEAHTVKSPKITLLIDGQENLQQFNEAKLKLVAVAIYFALIKLEENSESTLKLLVLDDFLTSLDMANRHYIIEYLFKEFNFYQIILFTHNLHFYNLILDWLTNENKQNEWDVKNIYLRRNKGVEESVIYDEKADYLEKAQESLDENKLSECGNLIRKEFERIVHELEKKYQLGDKEACNTIVNRIKNNQPIYDDSDALLQTILKKIKNCKNTDETCKTLTEIEKQITGTSKKLKKSFKDLVFLKKILMNPSSHDSPNAEGHVKEYRHCLTILKKLCELMDKEKEKEREKRRKRKKKSEVQ